MELNQLCLSILEYILDNSGKGNALQIQKRFSISKRSLSYQIDKLNAFLKSEGIPEIIYDRGSYTFQTEYQNQLNDILHSDRIYHCYVCSLKERIPLLFLYIATQDSPSTIDSLCEQLQVSKNTIVSDVNILKKKLENAGLRLSSTHRSGFKISGDEVTLRLYLLENIHIFSSNKYSNFYAYLFLQKIYDQRYANIVSFVQLYRFLNELLMNQALITDYKLTRDSVEDVILHIFLILLRHKFASTSFYIDEIHKKEEFYLAHHILIETHKRGFSYDVVEHEQNYLTAILLSSKHIRDIPIQFIESDLVDFTDQFITNFEKLTFTHLENKEDFTKKLLLHIRPMYYRLKYNIKIKNVLNHEIQENYSMFFNITKKAILMIPSSLSQLIPDDEIAYLCVYLAGWVNQSAANIESGNAADTLLIVINDGISTSSLIELQLINLLKPLHFHYKIISSDSFDDTTADQYPLVLYNAIYAGNKDNVIPISSILTQSQRNRILQWSFSYLNVEHDNNVSRLYDIIKLHSTVHEEELLKAKLFHFLNNLHADNLQATSLRQILQPDCITLIPDQCTIDELLQVAVADFLAKGIVKPSYINSIQNILNTLGAYGEITSGVLLLHAEDVSHCKELGIHICNIKEHIQFRNSNTIHTILLLSTPDKISHLRILKDLSQIFGNKELLKQLHDFSFDDADDCYNMIFTILNSTL